MVQSVQNELVGEQKYISRQLANEYVNLKTDISSFISSDAGNNYASSTCTSLLYRGIKQYYKENVADKIDSIKKLKDSYKNAKERELREEQIKFSKEQQKQERERYEREYARQRRPVEDGSHNINLISDFENNTSNASKDSNTSNESNTSGDSNTSNESNTNRDSNTSNESNADTEPKLNTSKEIFSKIQEVFTEINNEVNTINKRMHDIIDKTNISIDKINIEDILKIIADVDNELITNNNYTKTAPSMIQILDYLHVNVKKLENKAIEKKNYYNGESKSILNNVWYWTGGYFAWTYNMCKYDHMVQEYSVFIKNNVTSLKSTITEFKDDFKSAIRIIDKLTTNTNNILTEEINNYDNIINHTLQIAPNMATIFDNLKIGVDN